MSTTITAKAELRKMLRLLNSDAYVESYLGLGQFRCRKKLSDGTIVHFSVSSPGFFKRPKR